MYILSEETHTDESYCIAYSSPPRYIMSTSNDSQNPNADGYDKLTSSVHAAAELLSEKDEPLLQMLLWKQQESMIEMRNLRQEMNKQKNTLFELDHHSI